MALKINQFKYACKFQIADVRKSIILAGILRTHGLLIDIAKQWLVCLDFVYLDNILVASMSAKEHVGSHPHSTNQ